jgi:hypothetical protein
VDIDIILMIPNILGSIISYIIINMGFEHWPVEHTFQYIFQL